jgi:hypothetical protein
VEASVVIWASSIFAGRRWRARLLTALVVAAAFGAMASGCGKGAPTATTGAFPVRIMAGLAARISFQPTGYCCSEGCNCLDSVRVSAFEIVRGEGQLRASSAVALSYGDTVFDLDLRLPHPDRYRIAVELTGYRVLPAGPTRGGTQFYGLQTIEPTLTAPAPVIAILEDAVPSPNVAYGAPTVLHWPPVAGATGYTVADMVSGETLATSDTLLVLTVNYGNFRIRAEFVDGLHGAYSGIIGVGEPGRPHESGSRASVASPSLAAARPRASSP